MTTPSASWLVETYPTIDPLDSERRYLLTAAEVDGLEARIAARTVSVVYDLERPWSYSRTTYFDTPALDYLRTCDGPLVRRLRTREYASARTGDDEPLLSGLTFLELKQAAGPARRKLRFSTTSADLEAIMSSAAGERVIPLRSPRDPAIPRALRDELARGDLRPQLTTWYRRRCRIAEEGRLRITIDEELCYCSPVPLGAVGQAARPAVIVGRGPGRVLEIKSQGPLPQWLAPFLDGFQEAPGFSKFRAGMAVLGEVPAHRPAVTVRPSLSGHRRYATDPPVGDAAVLHMARSMK